MNDVTQPGRSEDADATACVECNHSFPESELVRYGELPVCMACKEKVLDKLKMGLPIGSGPWVLGRSMLVLPKSRTPLRKVCLMCGNESTQQVRLPKTEIDAPLCDFHFERGRKLKWARTLGVPILIVLTAAFMIVAVIADEAESWVASATALVIIVAVVLVGFIVDRAAKAEIRVVRMDEKHVFAANAGADYLRTLPRFPES